MKKNFKRYFGIFCLAALLELFVSCDDKIMGYGVLLWNVPEYGLQSGTVLPVYIRSNISQVYVVGIETQDPETSKVSMQKIEIPLWKITNPVKKSKIGSVQKKYNEYAHYYASVKLDGLPCREEPVNTSKQVYRLRKGEVIKVLYKGEGEAPKTGSTALEGDWFKVLTSEGTDCWCFSLNLNIYETDAFGEQIGGNKIEIEQDVDEEYDAIVNRPWYPEEFDTMISTGNIDISRLHSSYNFTIDTKENKVSLNMIDIHESWDYKGYSKTDDNQYTLKDIPIIVIYKKSSFIIVRYTDDSGKPQEINLVAINSDISDIVAKERTRRTETYEKLVSKTGALSSSNYGNLELKEDGTFSWTNYKLLVPSVISAGAKEAGTSTVRYALGKKLSSSYDGVVTFKFDGSLDEVNFLYKFENDGVRFEDATGATIQGNLVTERGKSPLIVYFKKK